MLRLAATMLHSILVVTSALLLADCIGAIDAITRGNEIVAKDAAEIRDGEITISQFKWMYNETANDTQLTICTEEDLGNEFRVNPTLIISDGEGLRNIEGQVLPSITSWCSLFTLGGLARLGKNETTYILSIIAANDTIHKSGSIIFAMPVEISTISCNGQSFTRAVGLTEDIILDHPCIDDEPHFANGSVCYIDGEFFTRYLCYHTVGQPENFTVCLMGSSQTTSEEIEEQLSISYLAYASEEAGDAHLSLKFENDTSSDDMEAIIWNKRNISITTCIGANCFIPTFTPGFSRYNVCVVTFVDSLPIQTFTSSITDLAANSIVYKDSPLLQFDFTNANEDQYYIAYIVDNTHESTATNITINCSNVISNQTCHGYFESKCENNSTITVEYATASGVANGNKIMYPC